METKKPLLSVGRLTGAGKWVTVSVTTVAAIIGILVNARNLGFNVGAVGFADLAARRVLLMPRMDTLTAIGDTLHLAATVTDDHGSTLSGANIVWTTDDSSVAWVDSSGGVIAKGPGTATINAAVREHSARARVTIWQRVRSVAIAHDTLLRLPEGTSVQLVAHALDARGHPVAGRTVQWKTADSGVVRMGSDGSASAAAPGRTVLTAATDGYSASIPAEVALTASSLKLLGGSNQRAPAGQRLPQVVQIQVFSRGGRPVPDALITFATEAGEGTVAPETAATDRSGRARTTWTLGPHPGWQQLLVTVGGADTSLTVVAEADPVPSNTRIQPAREIAASPASSPLPEPVGIRVTDAAGAAAADVPVVWTALDGGKLEAMAARTDSLGEAWARWTLGPRAGTQRARVQVGNPRTMPAFTVTATAAAEMAASVALVSGGSQVGPVGSALKVPIVAVLTDRNGNPVPGATAHVVPKTGSVTDSAPVADNKGRIQISWTLGTKAGPQSLELAQSKGPPVRVTVRAVPDEPANISATAMPPSAPANRLLAKPIVVTVTDAYGNTISNVQVVFSVTGGVTAPVRVMTDAKGQAATRWTLGPIVGDQTLTATVRGTTVKTTALVRATKGGGKK